MKHLIDFRLINSEPAGPDSAILKLEPIGTELPEIAPGQFVEVHIPDSPGTFLRRPISVNFADPKRGELWLLVRDAGEGTHRLCELQAGAILNIMLPLGRGFSKPSEDTIPVLVGGGVGVAPLLYFASKLTEDGHDPIIVVGGKTKEQLLEKDYLLRYGHLCLSTDDGSEGSVGLVTENPVFEQLPEKSAIYCCGPLPMMKSVAALSREKGFPCEVSLENKMACGLGACLCCVEETTTGNRCVCTDGPVFNIDELQW